MKKTKPRMGDVLMIPVSMEAFALAKIMFISTRDTRLMILGVATDRTYGEATLPDPLPRSFPRILLTSITLVENRATAHLGKGPWRVVGHDPAPVPADASLRISNGEVYREDQPIRKATEEDRKKLPFQGIDGCMLVEWRIQDALGIPRTPKRGDDDKAALAKAARAKAAAARADSSGAIDEDRFWQMIEDAWTTSAPPLARKRPGVSPKATNADAEAVSKALSSKVVPALAKALGDLTRDELIAFDRILEAKLYDLDRADIQAETDGSDDGFLYARGYIVGTGQAYCRAVLSDPKRAFTDMEEERIAYLPQDVFEERFDEHIPPSGISRETGSNEAGWKTA
jgi:hypothetical protein